MASRKPESAKGFSGFARRARRQIARQFFFGAVTTDRARRGVGWGGGRTISAWRNGSSVRTVLRRRDAGGADADAELGQRAADFRLGAA